MLQSSFNQSVSMHLRPCVAALWAALGFVACSLSSNVYAKQDVFSHHTETVQKGVFDDGVFAIRSDGTNLTSGDIQAEDNQLTIGGSVKVNGPIGAFAFRSTATEELPDTPEYKVHADNNRLVVNQGVQASAMRGVYIAGVNEASVNNTSIEIRGGEIHSKLVSPEDLNNAKDKYKNFPSYGVQIKDANKGSIRNTRVVMKGGSFSGSLFGVGGWAVEAVEANDNRITIQGGEFKGSIFGLTTWNTVSINANNNHVTISGGSFPQGINHVIGTWLKAQNFVEAHDNHIVLNNNVEVTKVLTPAAVYLDKGQRDDRVFIENGNYASLTNNTVTLQGQPTFAKGSYLLGAGVDFEGFEESFDDLSHYNPRFDLFSGNTLNISSKGIVADNVGNFQYYHFDLPSNFEVNKDVALQTANLYLDGLNQAAGKHAEIGTVQIKRAQLLSKGDYIGLIHADNLSGSLSNQGQALLVQQGVSFIVPTEVNQSSHDIGLTVVDKPKMLPQTKVLSEGYLAGMALGIQAADLIAEQGLTAVSQASEGVKGFAVLAGGQGRYKTGSHIDTDSVSLATGATYTQQLGDKTLTFGGFIEAGRSSYDTTNHFDTKVKGDGKAHYEGLGLLAKMHFQHGFYTEGSVRIGRMHNKFNTGLFDNMGGMASYKADSSYVGAHLGIGKVWSLSEKTSIDVYGKYLWSRLGSEHVRLSTAETVSFDAINSHRVRMGARLNFAPNDVFHPYVGAAFEHEFAAKAKANVYSLPVDAPTMKGNIGLVEAGIRLVPAKAKGLSAELGVRAYAGKRQDVLGQLVLNYSF